MNKYNIGLKTYWFCAAETRWGQSIHEAVHLFRDLIINIPSTRYTGSRIEILLWTSQRGSSAKIKRKKETTGVRTTQPYTVNRGTNVIFDGNIRKQRTGETRTCVMLYY
jgi:hypothetical protein